MNKQETPKNWYSNAGTLDDLREECAIRRYEYEPKFRVVLTHVREFPTAEEVLFCTWQEDSYAGSFYLLWRRCGKLYEMSLSHCSCNAYSDGEVQDNCWSRNPEITVAYLRQRACPVNSWDFSSEEGYAAAKLSWDTLLKELES